MRDQFEKHILLLTMIAFLLGWTSSLAYYTLRPTFLTMVSSAPRWSERNVHGPLQVHRRYLDGKEWVDYGSVVKESSKIGRVKLEKDTTWNIAMPSTP